MPSRLNVAPEVAAALAEHRPVVALESTIISHGLPRPRNHEAAIEFETMLRDAGVTPATIAVLDGVPQIGLDAEGVRRISEDDLAKASVRDLPIIAAAGSSAATTVAATSHLAALAGIRVFATGGLGGRSPRGVRHVRRVGRPLYSCRHSYHRRVGGCEVGARHRGDVGTARDPVHSGDRFWHSGVSEFLAAGVCLHARLVGGRRLCCGSRDAGSGRARSRAGDRRREPDPA